MLSILIPVFNFKVEKLVRVLMRQCHRAGIDYEILCFDDGSRKKIRYENSVLSDYFGVNYTELSENLGRARIRNWMAKCASGSDLLFLDCDSKVKDKEFIHRYLEHIDGYDIVAGGRVYAQKPPRAKSKFLHWQYGRKHESKKAAERQKHPARYFHSNNFMVRRDIMIKHPFDESIRGYGYEDLLWARQILESGLEIRHIENPVVHLGLEKADKFLKKTDNAIDNLADLHQRNIEVETRLTAFAERLKKLRLDRMIYHYLDRRSVRLRQKLLGKRPGMLDLQMYKLHRYWKRIGPGQAK